MKKFAFYTVVTKSFTPCVVDNWRVTWIKAGSISGAISSLKSLGRI